MERDKALKVFQQNPLDLQASAFKWGLAAIGQLHETDRGGFRIPRRRLTGISGSHSGWRGSMAKNALLRSVKGLGAPSTVVPTNVKKARLKVAVPEAEE